MTDQTPSSGIQVMISDLIVGRNLPEDAVYPFAELDGDGKPFNGANKYSLHFTKAGIPPVDAFWSLTM